MTSLVDSLLALARFDAGTDGERRELVNLESISQDCLKSVQPLADERGVKLSSDLVSANCEADPNQLTQVINNLLENAITYSSSGGKVRLSLRDQGDTISLDVKDSGEGIAEDDLPHLFDRFFRVDQSRTDSESHSGLGLAICKAIVEAHGGEIGVESTLGDGSVFTVSIPVSRS